MFKRKDREERKKVDFHKGVHEVGTQRGQGTTRGGWDSWSCGTVAQLPPEMGPETHTPNPLVSQPWEEWEEGSQRRARENDRLRVCSKV